MLLNKNILVLRLIKSICFGLINLTGSHSDINLSEKLKDLFTEFIISDNVTSITG